MRKAAIIAFIAVGSSLAVYAGVSHAGKQKNQTESCDKTECCPMGSEECCSFSEE